MVACLNSRWKVSAEQFDGISAPKLVMMQNELTQEHLDDQTEFIIVAEAILDTAVRMLKRGPDTLRQPLLEKISEHVKELREENGLDG